MNISLTYTESFCKYNSHSCNARAAAAARTAKAAHLAGCSAARRGQLFPCGTGIIVGMLHAKIHGFRCCWIQELTRVFFAFGKIALCRSSTNQIQLVGQKTTHGRPPDACWARPRLPLPSSLQSSTRRLSSRQPSAVGCPPWTIPRCRWRWPGQHQRWQILLQKAAFLPAAVAAAPAQAAWLACLRPQQ